MNAIATAATKIEGGQAALARLLEVSPQAVNQWCRGLRQIPEKHCPAIEAATGVRCEAMRPDVVWTRDTAGVVTGYHVRIGSAA